MPKLKSQIQYGFLISALILYGFLLGGKVSAKVRSVQLVHKFLAATTQPGHQANPRRSTVIYIYIHSSFGQNNCGHRAVVEGDASSRASAHAGHGSGGTRRLRCRHRERHRRTSLCAKTKVNFNSDIECPTHIQYPCHMGPGP